MILSLNERPQEAVAVIDASGTVLKYGELLAFSEKIGALLPQRSLLFLLTENNVGGIAWSIGSINSGNVPLILNAHIEEGLFIICLRFTVLLMCVYHHRWRTHCNMSLCMSIMAILYYVPEWNHVGYMMTCPICCRLPALREVPNWFVINMRI